MTLQDREQSLMDCTRCSNCRWVPNMESGRFAQICPSIHYGKFHPYSGGGKLITGYALLHGSIGYDDALLDSVYACSGCGGCEVACNATYDDLIEPLEGIYALRQKIVSDGRLPPALGRVLDNLRSVGSPAAGTSPDRGTWCSALDIPQGGREAPPEMLLLVGDAAFDPDLWPQLHWVVDVIKSAGADFAIAGSAEVDGGGLAFEIGDKALAIDLAQRFAAMVEQSGARVLLTTDDALFATLRAIFPRLGVQLSVSEVLHVSQWLARQADALKWKPGSGTATVTYHDTCRLGRLSEPVIPWSGEHEVVLGALRVRTENVPTRFGNGGVYEEPRRLLAGAGAGIVEMPRNRESTFCCGLGAGAKAYSPEFAASAARERLEEACSTGAATLVTSCSGCAAHLQEVAEAHLLPITVKSLLAYLHDERMEG